jgi:hypothetical protein
VGAFRVRSFRGTTKKFEFERTNYWPRKNRRVLKQLAATAEFPIIGAADFSKFDRPNY